METVLPAPFAATVKELLVATGSQVETGAPLVRLEPVAEGEEDAAEEDDGPAEDLELPSGRAVRTPAEEAESELTDLSGMLLGYDLDPGNEGRTLAAYLTARESLAADGEVPRPRGLAARALRGLRRAEPQPSGRRGPARREPRALAQGAVPHLSAVAGHRAGRAAGRLPAAPAASLRHYGVENVDRTRELENAVFQVFLAQQRSAPDVQLVMALLQRWMNEPVPADPTLAAAAREVLDRLVLATQLRFPIVGDLARSVRFRWFDQPLVDADRAAVLASVRDQVAPARRQPRRRRPRRADRRPGRHPGADRPVPAGAARERPAVDGADARGADPAPLPRVRAGPPDVDVRRRAPFAIADYTLDKRPTHLVSTIGRVSELVPDSDLVKAVTREVDAGEPGHEAVVDLYLSWPEAPENVEEASAALREMVEQLDVIRRVRRIAIAVGAGESRAPRTSPSGRPRTASSSKTTWSVASTRWWGAGSTCGGCGSSP